MAPHDHVDPTSPENPENQTLSLSYHSSGPPEGVAKLVAHRAPASGGDHRSLRVVARPRAAAAAHLAARAII